MKITKDINFKESGGMLDMFDNYIKAAFNVTDEEYDYLCENITDDEMRIIVIEEPTFAQKRQMIEIRNRYLALFNSK